MAPSPNLKARQSWIEKVRTTSCTLATVLGHRSVLFQSPILVAEPDLTLLYSPVPADVPLTFPAIHCPVTIFCSWLKYLQCITSPCHLSLAPRVNPPSNPPWTPFQALLNIHPGFCGLLLHHCRCSWRPSHPVCSQLAPRSWADLGDEAKALTLTGESVVKVSHILFPSGPNNNLTIDLF